MSRGPNHAAPPDDGHQGTFTVPGDVLTTPRSDEATPPPALHRDVPPRHEPEGWSPVWLLVMIAALSAVLVGVWLWIYY